MSRPQLPTSVVDEIVRAYEDGDDAPVIADRMGLERSRVYKYLKRRGVPRRSKVATQEERDGMVALWKTGETEVRAAAAFGHSHMVLRLELKKLGLATRPRGLLNRVSVDVEDAVVERMAAGGNVQEIAADVGITTTSCYRIAKRNGLPPRPDYVTPRRYEVNHSFFSSVDTEEKAYVLGLLTADGSVSEDRQTVSLQLKLSDKAHVVAVASLMGSTYPVHECEWFNKTHGKTQRAAKVAMRSPQLVKDLCSLGVIPRKSLVVQPWNGPEHLMRHYFRGLVDGDGWVVRQKRQCIVGLCGTRAVCESFAAFVGCAIDWKLRVMPFKSIFVAKVGGVGLPQAAAKLLYDGANIYLQRKWDKAQKIKELNPCVRRRAAGIFSQFSHVTPERIEELFATCGFNWKTVAKEIGCTDNVLYKLRKHHGMAFRECEQPGSRRPRRRLLPPAEPGLFDDID